MHDEPRPPVVLVPRGGAWGATVAGAARARGLDAVVVPLITDAPPEDPAALDAALARLAAEAGRHDSPSAVGTGPDGAGSPAPWLAVTSATAVRMVAGRMPSLPAGVRVACVGQATARAARQAGWRVDVVPDTESAAGLVAAFPQPAGRVLFPRSELAAPTLVEGLRARGIDVEDVVAYRTVGTGDEPVRLDRAPDAVLVTSGSVASQVARRMTPLDPGTRIACIGPGTAAAAREVGLPVHVVARSRSADALLDAVAEALRTEAPEAPEAPEPPRSGRSS
ncbi:uroporphyrinogen-III synthase [Curtobacterium sp. SP.BCp]|uniref:uroporphyrinogen-III synthase n=1 Tax=Curtobacterium sp. SP.BCp TaxID=3435230 RepID=UPI003F7326AE